MIEEKDLNADVLAAAVNRLMKDTHAREEMRENALKAANSDAAYRMIDLMEEMIRK